MKNPLASLLMLLTACHPDTTATPTPQSLTSPASTPGAEAPRGPLRWEARGKLPKRHPQACDLESTNGDLYIAASTNALAENGAGLYRLHQNEPIEKIFDWSGQGFLRVHQVNGQIFVPDADAPFGVSFLFRLDVDGFVFAFDVSDPDQYTKEVIPSVYHVIDTAALDGKVYASTGAYAEGEVPYRNERNPAALFVQGDPGEPWRRIVEFPQVPKGNNTGVVRFTYLLPLEDGTLLAGFTDWSRVAGGDGAVRIEGLPNKPTVTRAQGLSGNTLRWGRFQDKIYQISDNGGAPQFNISKDQGRTFSRLSSAPLHPQSLVSTSDTLFLLADGVMYRSEDGESFTAVTAQNPGLRYQWSPLTTAPIELHQGALWAANPITGELFSAVSE